MIRKARLYAALRSEKEDPEVRESQTGLPRPSPTPAGLDLPLKLLERLVTSQIVPAKAKLAALEGCLLELEQQFERTGTDTPKHRQLRRRLREMTELLRQAPRTADKERAARPFVCDSAGQSRTAADPRGAPRPSTRPRGEESLSGNV